MTSESHLHDGRTRRSRPPQRRCVACRRSAPKRELVRLALRDARDGGAGTLEVIVDPTQTMPGRGAYVCGVACLRRAIARGRLAGAFRRAVSIDPQTVESMS
jgi:predicted RNA-binding protein YlxR (DUF448 family)